MATQAQIGIPVGKVVGHGVSAGSAGAVTINCGFKPRKVTVYAPHAENDGIEVVWLDCSSVVSSASGTAKTNSETANTNAATAIDEGVKFLATDGGKVLAENGITAADGGFVIGTACQIADADYFWEAER